MDGRDCTGREAGIEFVFVVDAVAGRLPGVVGLEVTEAELVSRTDVLLLLEK